VTELGARRARIEELLAAARVLADAASPESRRLRARLQETTGLSRPSIDLALARCLEQRLDEAQLAQLISRAPVAPRAHVLLSANVFVAPLRAIALGRAASARVLVRPSRRDPALAEALAELVPDGFELVPELRPEPGDHFWAYGSDATLASVRAELPTGVTFHGHGSGLGAVVVDYSDGARAVHELAAAVALDTVLFDQRGCLSPRLVCVQGDEDGARALVEAIARELARLEHELPPGTASAEQLAEQRRFADSARYAFEVVAAGSGVVSLALDGRLALPPAARNLHVVLSVDAAETLRALRPHLTCIASHGSDPWRARLRAAFPGARACEPGQMQSPPLDGPVDLRGSTGAEISPSRGL
jgi:hypothetical protein